MSSPTVKYNTEELMNLLAGIGFQGNDMKESAGPIGAYIFGEEDTLYSDKDFLNTTIMHLMNSPDSSEINGEPISHKRLGQNLRDMYSDYEEYDPSIFYAGAAQPIGSLFFNLVGRFPEIGVSTFDSAITNPIYNLELLAEGTQELLGTGGRGAGDVPTQADLWRSIQYPMLKQLNHPFADWMDKNIDNPGGGWEKNKKWFGFGEAQYQMMDEYRMVKALKLGDKRLIEVMVNDLENKMKVYEAEGDTRNAERYANYIDYMNGVYGHPDVADFMYEIDRKSVDFDVNPLAVTQFEEITDKYQPYWQMYVHEDKVNQVLPGSWQYNFKGVEYDGKSYFGRGDRTSAGDTDYKVGLEPSSPLALFHNWQLNHRFSIEETRDWLGKVWGDPIIDKYYSQPHMQQHMSWYANTTPSDINFSTAWVKDFTAFLGTSLSSTIGSVGVGALTTLATKNIKAGINAGTATMFVLEASDQYEQGIQYWESLGFDRDEARSMAANEAVVYGVGSAAIERFGAWNIYLSKLGPQATKFAKRNILTKMNNKITEKVTQLATKSKNIPGVSRLSGLSVKAAPFVGAAFVEAFQEEMQLMYQSLIQAGYSDASWIDGFAGEWKEAGAGAVLASVVMGGGSSILGNQLKRRSNKAKQYDFNTIAQSSNNKTGSVNSKLGDNETLGGKDELIRRTTNRMFGNEESEIKSKEGATNTLDSEVKSWGDYAAQLEAQYLTEGTFNEDYVQNILKKKDRNSYSDLDLAIEQGSRYDSKISQKLFDIYQRTGDTKFLEYNEETGEGIESREVRDKFKRLLALEIKKDKSNQVNKEWVGRQKKPKKEVDDFIDQVGADEAGLLNAIEEGNVDTWFDTKLEEQGADKFIEAQSSKREARMAAEQEGKIDKALDQQESAFEKSLEQEQYGQTQINKDIEQSPQQTIDKLKRDAPNVRAQKILSLSNTNLVKLAKALGIKVPKSKSDKAMNELRNKVSNVLTKGSTNKVNKPKPKTPAIQDKVFGETAEDRAVAEDRKEAEKRGYNKELTKEYLDEQAQERKEKREDEQRAKDKIKKEQKEKEEATRKFEEANMKYFREPDGGTTKQVVVKRDGTLNESTWEDLGDGKWKHIPSGKILTEITKKEYDKAQAEEPKILSKEEIEARKTDKQKKLEAEKKDIDKEFKELNEQEDALTDKEYEDLSEGSKMSEIRKRKLELSEKRAAIESDIMAEIMDYDKMSKEDLLAEKERLEGKERTQDIDAGLQAIDKALLAKEETKAKEVDSGKLARFEAFMKTQEQVGSLQEYADSMQSKTDSVSESQQKKIDEDVAEDTKKLNDDLCLD